MVKSQPSPEHTANLDLQLIALVRSVFAEHGVVLPEPGSTASHTINDAVETAMDEAGYFDGGITAMWANISALLSRSDYYSEVDDETLWLASDRLARRLLITPIMGLADARALVDLLEYANEHSPDWEGLHDCVIKVRAYLSQRQAS